MVTLLGGPGAAPPGPLSIVDRTSRTEEGPTYVKGHAGSRVCPRGGSVRLTTGSGRTVRMETQCKVWRCVSCRDRMISLFKGRVEIGCSRLGRCAFITLTYKRGSPRLKRAGCVRKDWTALWRQLRDSPLRRMKWLRVMEITKAGTPHHHLVLGPIPDEMSIRCWKGKMDGKQFATLAP